MLRLVLNRRFIAGSTLAIMGVCLWCLPLQHAVMAVTLYFFLNLLMNLATCFFVFEPKLAQPVLMGPGWTFAVVPFWFWLVLASLPLTGKTAYWTCVGQLPLDIKRVVVFYTPEWLWVRRD